MRALRLLAIVALIFPAALALAKTSPAMPEADFTVPAQPVWSFVTHGAVRCNPLSDGRTVYAASDDEMLYALSLETGGYRWRCPLGSAPASAPLLDDRRVVIGTASGMLLSVRPPAGKAQARAIWRFDAGAAVTGAPLLTSKRLVIFGTAGSEFIAVKADTGELVWRKSVSGPIVAPVTLSPKALRMPRLKLGERARPDEFALCSSTDGIIYALAEETGEEVWTFNTKGRIDAAPLTGEDKLWVGNRSGSCFCLEAANGRKLWETQLSGPVLSTAAIAYGVVHVATADGAVYALSSQTGAQLWRSALGHPLSSPPILLRNRQLFVASSDGALFSLSAKTGEVLWQQLGSDPVLTAPTILARRLLYGTQSGRLEALLPVSKARLATEPTVVTAPDLPAAETATAEPAPKPALSPTGAPPAAEPASSAAPAQPAQPQLQSSAESAPAELAPAPAAQPPAGGRPLMLLITAVQAGDQLPVLLANSTSFTLVGNTNNTLVRVTVGGKPVSTRDGRYVAEENFGDSGVYPLTVTLKYSDGSSETLRRIVVVDTSGEPRSDWAARISPNGDGRADELYLTPFADVAGIADAQILLEVKDATGTVARSWSRAASEAAPITWDGKNQTGGVCPAGAYRVVFTLQRADRTDTMSQLVIVQ